MTILTPNQEIQIVELIGGISDTIRHLPNPTLRIQAREKLLAILELIEDDANEK